MGCEMSDIKYAKAGETHEGYSSHQLEIVDLNGVLIPYVIEANVLERWYLRYKTREDGSFIASLSDEELETELVKNADFLIRVKQP